MKVKIFLALILLCSVLQAQWQYSASYNEALRYYEEGNIASALKSMELAKETYETFNGDLSTHSYSVIINNLALFYNQLGDYPKAGPLFEQALKINRNLYSGDNADLATMINNLATFYNRAGKYTEAEELYNEALEMRKRLFGKSHSDIANSLNNMAAFYKGRGRLKEAEEFMKEALAIIRDVYILDNPETATCLNNLGLLYIDACRYDEALPLLEEAFNIRKIFYGNEHPDIAGSLTNLASVYYELGRYQETEKYLSDALEIRKKILKRTHPDIALSMNNLAAFYDLTGRQTTAIMLFREALKLYEEIYRDPHPDYALALNNLAVLYFRNGDYSSAERYFNAASEQYRSLITGYSFSITEREREQYLAAILTEMELFVSYAGKRASENPAVAAVLYNNTLLTKGFLLNSSVLLREKILSSRDTEVISLYDRFIAARNLLSGLAAMPAGAEGISYDSVKAAAEKLEKQLSVKSRHFSDYKKETDLNWQDVRERLKDDEAAVEVIRSRVFDTQWRDSVHYTFLIVKKGSQNPEIVVLENGNELESKVLFRYRQQIRDVNKNPDTLLFNFLWAPVSEKLRDVKKIYFAPDGIYNQINLQTLYNPAINRYLADETAVVLLTNTARLAVSVEKQQVNNRAVLAGYPDYNAGNTAEEKTSEAEETPQDVRKEIAGSLQRFGLSDLPGTKTETERISALLKENGYDVELLLGKEADEGNIKRAGNPDILHLATHGFFLKNVKKENPGNFLAGTVKTVVLEEPMNRSGLFFAGAAHTAQGGQSESFSGDNGIFTAFEAANLNLTGTRLVVLSACETALGDIKNGEGVYGLSRAFIQAGAGAVIMSLWKVDDKATQELMINFYINWLNTQDKQSAFSKAVLKVREKYPAPYYWGAFIMTGM